MSSGGREAGTGWLRSTPHSVRVHGPRGRLLRTVDLPRGLTAVGSALAPDGTRLAVITQPLGRRAASELLLVRLGRAAPPRSLFSARGSFEGLTWSIDGSLLVLGLPEADQWLFVRSHGSGGLESVRHIREQFAGGREPRRGAFPRPAGWCYAQASGGAQPPCSSGSAP